ncbi:MAG: hypothetical protein DRJ66_02365 [Thermoprotei archaeon]|nr:MAG: hypothetical protein DRJ66_02365 [Thermoprotei archaeon]RLF18489.1 MAG: hypothetical protein DRZ82_08100 [Thermoprotei archaeon]
MNYEEIIREIQKRTGLSKEEVIRKIYQKIEELGGLINEEAAAFLIAKEMGIEIQKGEMLRKAELKIADIRPGMRNIIVSGVVVNVKNDGRNTILEIKDDSRARIKLMIPSAMLDRLPRVGDYVRAICRDIRRGEEKFLYAEVKEGGIVINPEGEKPSVRIFEDVEGILVKKIDLGIRNGKYGSLLILKTNDEYKVVKVESGLSSLFSRLSPGMILRIKAYRVGGFLNADADYVTIKGKGSVDPIYERVLSPDELKPGLKFIDIRGKIVYVSMLKRYVVNDNEIIIRDILLEGRGSIIKVRLKGELAERINESLKGREIILRNMNIKADERGLIAYSGKLSSFEML